MQIVFLNTWHAEKKEELAEFINEQDQTDIFCLQEVDAHNRPFFEKLLPGYTPFYAERENDIGEPDDRDFANATYVKEGLEVLEQDTLLCGIEGAGLGLYSRVKSGDEIVNICNVHGQSRPGDKLDSPQRIGQSKALIEFLSLLEGEKIVGGDFNLLPETESVKMFEDAGYRNLIKDFNVSTTRNRINWERHPDNKQYFADYVFASSEVSIQSFRVIENEISDHLPMVLNTVPVAVPSGR